MRMPLVALALLSALPAVPAAQTATAAPRHRPPAPTSTAITAADLMTRLYIFADDSMQGREAGTPGHARAVEYIARELTRLGLQPAGDSGTFFQTVPLEVTRLVDGTALRVGDSAFALRRDFLVVPAIGLPDVGALIAAEAVPAIYGGKLGESPLVAPDAVAGKLVVFQAPDGPNAWQFWSVFGPAQYARYAGAAGILVVSLDRTPDGAVNFFLSPQVRLAAAAGPDPRIAMVLVTPAVAEVIFGGPLAGLLPGTEGRAVTARGGVLRGPPEAPGRNVVAIVPGSDPALRGQYVAFGAHTDHEGFGRPVDHDSLRIFNRIVRPAGADDAGRQATPAGLDSVRARLDRLRRSGAPARPDSIMNGADDDGSGSMALLEIAEHMVRNPARRSALFVWHVAEEQGLYGAQWFSDYPTVPRDSIVAQFNMDMIGRGRAEDITNGGPGYIQLIGSRRLSTELGDLVERVNRDGGHGFTFDYQYDAPGHPAQYYCRSDHYMYARYGIPVTFFSTGGHPDYHMVTDEPQYIDYPKYARVTSLIMEVGRAVANLDRPPLVDQPRPDPQGRCRQ